jgi:hypothetical protein
LSQVLIPALHEGQNPHVIASEGARSLIGKERTLPREVGMMRRTIPLSVAAVSAVLALGSVLAPAASASSPRTCRVDNQTEGTDFSSDTGLALTDAIAAAAAGDQLAVIGTCSGNFALDKNLTLTGISQKKFPTPTLDGNQAGTTLVVRNATVTLSNLTITGGATIDHGGGIINNFGTLTLNDSTVRENTAMGRTADGGGIFNNNGTLLLQSSTVSGNTATGTVAEAGGGILNNFGTLTLDNSTVSENTAMGGPADGGGIFNNSGTVRLDDSTVSGNRAEGTIAEGGGIFNNFGHLMLDSSTVSGNTAVGTLLAQGGGIFNNAGTIGTVTLVESIVSGNIPDNCVNVPGC